MKNCKWLPKIQDGHKKISYSYLSLKTSIFLVNINKQLIPVGNFTFIIVKLRNKTQRDVIIGFMHVSFS